MFEVVVKESQIQKAIPLMMPRNVELYPLSPEDQLNIRQAASANALFVRVNSPEGEQIRVRALWPDPHDPKRITLILA